MEHLTKHQLILVALLVSFVTSLATGIVTVSLMDQMPPDVARTVSQVVEKTIQQVVPQDQSATAVSAIAASPAASAADAVSIVSRSVVRLRSAESDSISGLGLVVSKQGVIVADKSSIAQLPDYEAVFPDNSQVPVTIVRSQVNGDIVFLAPIFNPDSATTSDKTAKYVPVDFSQVSMLGQNTFSLSGASNLILGQGLVTEMPTFSASTTGAKPISTSIPLSSTMLGSPLFDINGKIVGLRTSSTDGTADAKFYPVWDLKDVIPSL